jgi:chitodextrinase
MAGHSGRRFLSSSHDPSLAPKSMRFLVPLFLLAAALPLMAAPPVPTGLVANNVTATSFTLDWADSTGASSYKIYRDGISFGTSGTSVFAVTGLTAGTTYTFTVSAVNADATPESAQSAGLEVTTTTIPDGPANLRVIDRNGDSVTLAWEAVTGATKYTLYRDDEALPATITGTTYTDTGLEQSTEYTYFVTATTSAGESGDSNVITVTTFGDGTGKTAVWAKRFRQIDIDADGILTYEEYFLGHGGRLAEVIIMHRYEYMDTDATSEGVDLVEYAKSFGGRKFMSPSRPRQFFLADLDGNGALDPDEFSLTLGARTPWNRVVKIFNKKDKINPDDDYLSEFEFGIRTGSQDEPAAP